LKIENWHPRIQFAQLQGMADHLTLGLADMGYNANKLVPWGPIDSVFPYLLRRVQENQDIFSGTQFERELLWFELKRRYFGWYNNLGVDGKGWRPRNQAKTQ